MKNKRKIVYTILNIFLWAIVVFVLLFDFENFRYKSVVVLEQSAEAIVQPTPTPTPTPTDILATIAIAGDVMVHDSQLEHDYDEDEDIYEFKPTFEKIKSSIEKADFAMVNLETTIAGKELGYSGYPDFNTPESFIEALQYCGFDLVTLANNHILDRGVMGAEKTLENLEKLGMEHTGLSLDEQGFYDYYIKDINGIKVGIIPYTWKSTGVNSFENSKHILHFWNEADIVEQDIKNVQDLGAEYIIVLPHWGLEYQTTYSREQQRYAQNFIALGADAVIGSHPHVAQPATMMQAIDEQGNKREGFVVYSLGNFLANMRVRYNNSGIILNLTLRKTPQGEVTLDEIAYIPTLIMSKHIYRIEASDHVILPAGKYVHDPVLFQTLDEEHQEKVINAYNDIVLLYEDVEATPLDE